MWQVYEKTCTRYLEFKKNYLHFSCCIYFNQWTKAKGWQLVLLRNLLHALNIRNGQGVEEALVVPERSEQNTKLSSSRHRGQGEKNGHQHSLSKGWLRGTYQSLTHSNSDIYAPVSRTVYPGGRQCSFWRAWFFSLGINPAWCSLLLHRWAF